MMEAEQASDKLALRPIGSGPPSTQIPAPGIRIGEVEGLGTDRKVGPEEHPARA